MKKILLTCLFLLTTSECFANWVGGVELGDINVAPDGYVAVGLSTQPPGTCTNWSWYFRFDASTPGGKNMLATLMAAKVAGKTVNIWYSDSSSPGTNQTNGCNGSTMSVLQGISIP